MVPSYICGLKLTEVLEVELTNDMIVSYYCTVGYSQLDSLD